MDYFIIYYKIVIPSTLYSVHWWKISRDQVDNDERRITWSSKM